MLAGVFPVLATPFHGDGAPDEAGLAAIARYVIGAGADGVVFPGVASEYETLTPDERARLSDLVAFEARDARRSSSAVPRRRWPRPKRLPGRRRRRTRRRSW